METSNHEPLLQVEDLQTHFFSKEGTLRAVDGASFQVAKGEALGVAGESGCGKSVTAQSVLRIIPQHGKIVGGSIKLFRSPGQAVDLTELDWRGPEIRAIRGAEISMIFQEPMTSFSMVHTIGNQIMEVIRLHQKCSKSEARERAVEILDRVGMPQPSQAVDAYPFAISGGMRQRAMIAMALSCHPRLLIADEPTTAVDVTIQAQVLELMKELQEDLGMSLMIITHDLAVIAEMCDSAMIMYLGRHVESGPVQEIFTSPRHPYTVGLLNSVPKLGEGTTQQILSIRGVVPSPYVRPQGCPFHPRCDYFMPGVCDVEFPEETSLSDGHRVYCHLY